MELFAVKRTQVEMMVDRDYPIPKNESLMFIEHQDVFRPTIQLLKEFKKAYHNRGDLTQTYTNDNGEITYVFFAPETKGTQGKAQVEQFLTNVRKIRANVGIIISNADFTSSAKEELRKPILTTIQKFFDYELYINPTQHELVPPHEKLSVEEKRAKLAESKSQPSQILVLTSNDPIVRYYGWKPGDLIRVKRVNRATDRVMAKKSTIYRFISVNEIEVKKFKEKKK